MNIDTSKSVNIREDVSAILEERKHLLSKVFTNMPNDLKNGTKEAIYCGMRVAAQYAMRFLTSTCNAPGTELIRLGNKEESENMPTVEQEGLLALFLLNELLPIIEQNEPEVLQELCDEVTEKRRAMVEEGNFVDILLKALNISYDNSPESESKDEGEDAEI